jgi:hypothetical protein
MSIKNIRVGITILGLGVQSVDLINSNKGRSAGG